MFSPTLTPALDEKIIVATTRPETMLGDTAIAVHPDDPRYKVIYHFKPTRFINICLTSALINAGSIFTGNSPFIRLSTVAFRSSPTLLLWTWNLGQAL